MYKILIVEDDIDLKEGLEFALKEDGYEVLVAETKKYTSKFKCCYFDANR